MDGESWMFFFGRISLGGAFLERAISRVLRLKSLLVISRRGLVGAELCLG